MAGLPGGQDAAPLGGRAGSHRTQPLASPVYVSPILQGADPVISTVPVILPGVTSPYRWQEAWGDLPRVRDRHAWAHPGLAVGPGGSVFVADTAEPRLHVLDGASGSRIRSIPIPTEDAHGLAMESSAAGPRLWLADVGSRLWIRDGQSTSTGSGQGRVAILDLQTGAWLDVEPPHHDAYRESAYRPTHVTVDPGGDDVWIADGYGAHLVHRYGRDGAYRSTLSVGGRGSADGFDTPHATFVDRRGPEPRLLVTDRGHRRVRAFNLDGVAMDDLPATGLTSPSGISALGDLTLVAELNASVAVLDPDGHLIGRIGEGTPPEARGGWPNTRRSAGSVVRPRLVPGRFNSPHAMDVGPDGSIYVAEFVLGGRLVRITPDNMLGS